MDPAVSIEQPQAEQPLRTQETETPSFLEQPEGTQPIEGQQEEGQQPDPTKGEDQNQPESKTANWLEDGRTKDMWMGEDGNPDPNKLFQSYKQLEERLADSPERQALETVKQEHEQLKEEHTKATQLVDQVNAIMNHPVLGEKINQLLNEHEQAEARQRFGENLSPEQLNQMQEQDTRIKELQEWRTQQEHSKLEQESYSTAQGELQKIEAVAKEYGLAWEDQNKNAFVQHCLDKKVPISMMEAEFYRQAVPYMKKHFKEVGEQNAQENFNNGNNASILNGAENNKPSGENLSFKDKVMAPLLG